MFITLGGRDPDGKYHILVGDPGLAAEILGVELWPHSMQDAFDSIADQLAAIDDFTVERDPLPLAFSPEDVEQGFFEHRDEHIFLSLRNRGIETVQLSTGISPRPTMRW